MFSGNLWFAWALLPGLGIGVFCFFHWRDRQGIQRWATALLPCLMSVCLLSLATQWVRAPANSWNGTRLAPLMGLKYGYPLYSTIDRGPILPTIYPPGAYLPFAPALLASTPTAAILIAETLVMVYFFLTPSLVLLAGSGQQPGWVVTGLWGWCCFAGLALRNATTSYHLSSVHADAPCLAAMGMACALLYLSKSAPGWKTLLGSATCAVLAVWCKQTALPVLVALPLYILLAWGWRRCVVYTLLIAVVGALVSAAFVLAIGADVLRWHLITIPGSHSFDPPGLRGIWEAAAKAAPLIRVPCVLMAGIVIVQCWPRVGRAASSQAWLAENRWAIFLWLGVFLLPTGLLGLAKLGGDVNNLHCTYFWICAIVAFVVETVRAEPSAERALPWVRPAVLLVMLGLTTWGGLRMVRGGLDLPDRLRQLPINPQQAAYAFAKAHPQQAYFSWNPLSMLLAEGKLYHHDYAVADWVYAHHPPSRARLEADFPSAMRWMIIQPIEEQKYLRRVFPEFSRRVKLDALPRWPAFEKAEAMHP
jgi:hypothetical protein